MLILQNNRRGSMKGGLIGSVNRQNLITINGGVSYEHFNNLSPSR